MTVVDKPEHQNVMPCKITTDTMRLQRGAERECQPFFVDLSTLSESEIKHLSSTGLVTDGSLDICLVFKRHIQYLSKLWADLENPQLNQSYTTLGSSRPWMIYWTLHGCDLMNHNVDMDVCKAITKTIESCFTESEVTLETALVKTNVQLEFVSSQGTTTTYRAGGFGGGMGQMAHAATTYAAIMALGILSSRCPESLAALRRVRHLLYPWMLSLQDQRDGAFRMHHDGEIDVRATYCLFACARLLRIQFGEQSEELAAKFVGKCQTWEGGFGGEPFAEAHGGYTFCAIAALKLLSREDAMDTGKALAYLSRRQMSSEGGFNGRSNKLVDGCYSFWQGGSMVILSAIANQQSSTQTDFPIDPWLEGHASAKKLLFDQCMLQRYILLCAQDVNGGLRDKPSKNRDFYHTCYNLSGLSNAQHYDKSERFGHPDLSSVEQTHPCYNIRMDHVRHVLVAFK